jgi:SAM-dependent methyltransferase
MTAFDRFWRAIGRQFSCPSGLGGRLMGHVMELINEAPNREAIASLAIEPHDTVLELGFGPGRALETLVAMARSSQVYGVDLSEEMLASAFRRNKRAVASGRLLLFHGRIDSLPLEPGSIDKILAVNVVYFFDPSGRELRDARRLLKPGGKMVIYATDKSAMSRWKFAGVDTHRLFGCDELGLLITQGGFSEDEFSIKEINVGFGVKGLIATLWRNESPVRKKRLKSQPENSRRDADTV